MAALPTPRLEALLDRTAPTPGAGAANGRPRRATRSAPVLEAIERFDSRRRSTARSAALSALYPPRDFVYDVVLPLMRVVGERWHDGQLSIAQEHMASAVLRGVMGTLLRLHAAPHGASRLLFASPEGERHEFGLLASAMLAGAAGLGVVYLGPSLPAREIAARRADSGAAAVVLAVTGGAAGVGGPGGGGAAGAGAARRTLGRWTRAARFQARAGSRRRVVPIGSFEELERHLKRIGGK